MDASRQQDYLFFTDALYHLFGCKKDVEKDVEKIGKGRALRETIARNVAWSLRTSSDVVLF